MHDSQQSHRKDHAANRRIALYLAIVITIAWGVSFIIDVIDESYDPPASVHALMMIVAGSVFGEGLFQAAKKNGESSNGS